MTNTLTIPLKPKTDRSVLVNTFKLPYSQYKKFVKVSDNMYEHDYPQEIKNAIFCSFKVIPEYLSYYLFFFASQIAIKSGLTKICIVNNKKYPYFYYCDLLMYVVPASDRNDFNSDLIYRNFSADLKYRDFNIQVVDDIEDINIHSHLDIKKMTITDEEFKRLFGDNELLKENCKALSDSISVI